MILLRTHLPILALGAFGAFALVGTTTRADEDFGTAIPRITDAASRCASYGPGFVDLGNGTCARSGSHVRVELGTGRAASEGWTGRTSSAELRSEGTELMPGVGTSHQLRVRSGLQTLSPY